MNELNVNLINYSINQLKSICVKSNISFNDNNDSDSDDSVSTQLYDYDHIIDSESDPKRDQKNKRKTISEEWIRKCKQRKYKQSSTRFSQQIDNEINLLDLSHLCLTQLQSNQLYNNYISIHCLNSFKNLLQLTQNNGLVLDINRYEKHVLNACDNKHTTSRARVGVEREKWELLSEQYWAESIVDCKLHSDMSLVFLIKWCEFSHNDNTWQRLCDIIACDLILKDYHNKQQSEEEEENVCYSIEDFKKFNRYMKESYGNDGDIAVILKLNNKKLKEWDHSEKMLQTFKSKIELYCHSFNQIRVYKPEYLIPAKILIHLLVKELKIEQTFGSLKQFFEFFESRKSVKIAIKEWEREVNQSLINTNEPLIMAENNIDLEIPKPINYITKYKFHNRVNVLSTNIPITSCKCDDNCTRNRTCECCLKIYRDNKRFKTSNVLYECNSLCSCDPKICPNRRVQNGRQYELTVFRTDRKGWGVMTNNKIPFRSFIMEYIGEIISSVLTPDRDCTYFFNIDEEYCGKCLFVDGSTSGNITRYANHSCEPNMDMHMAVVDHNEFIPRITFFANRNIKPYEELTYHYGRRTLNLNENGDYVCNDYDTYSQDSGRGTSNFDDSDDNDITTTTTTKKLIYKKSFNSSDIDIKCFCGSIKCQKLI